jgi:quinolinate synthase
LEENENRRTWGRKERKMENKDRLIEKIEKLKKERNAVILAHNYQIPEVQDIADHRGDSLGLSQIASKTDADIIVFCGVRFMAETASILSPDKKVILPADTAGCPMADMITIEQLKKLKAKHPGMITLGYVNTSASVKAELDICCTSGNAIKVVNSLDSEEIIFVPDKYLAAYVARNTSKKIIPWNGYCPTHVKILPEHILEKRKQYPKAEVLVHPECTPRVIDLADGVFSTSGMVKYARKSNATEFIIGTEIGMIYRLQKDNPEKKFYPATELAICPNMKLTTLEKVLWALQDLKCEVNVPYEIQKKAKKAVDKMIEIV